MKKSKIFALLLLLVVTVVSLSSCGFLSEEQKMKAKITSGKITGAELLNNAGMLLNDTEKTYSQHYSISYKLSKVDRDRSYNSTLIDSENWNVIVLNTIGAGQWSGQSIRDNEPLKEHMTYYGYYYDKSEDPTNKYMIYYAPTNGPQVQEWVRGFRPYLLAGFLTTAIDYTKLANVGTWEVNRSPLIKDGKTLYTVTGHVGFNEGRNFLAPIESVLDLEIDPRLNDGSGADIIVNLREDGYIEDFSMSFKPATTVDKNFIFTEWKVYIAYGDINSFHTYTTPQSIVLNAVDENTHEEDIDYSVQVDLADIRKKATEEEDKDTLNKSDVSVSTENSNSQETKADTGENKQRQTQQQQSTSNGNAQKQTQQTQQQQSNSNGNAQKQTQQTQQQQSNSNGNAQRQTQQQQSNSDGNAQKQTQQQQSNTKRQTQQQQQQSQTNSKKK